MRYSRKLGFVTCGPVALMACSLAFAQPMVSSGAETLDGFQLAKLQLDDCHWAEAFDAFADLADRGDPAAARVAILMAQHGRRLYGVAFNADASQRQRWLDLASGGTRAKLDSEPVASK